MFWWTRKVWKDFQVNLSFLGWFLTCILLESFIKFPIMNHHRGSWYGKMGSFCKSLKIEKTVVCDFYNVLNWSIYYQRRSERLFEVVLVFQISSGVCCIRMFCKFPGWSLLGTTIIVHDSYYSTDFLVLTGYSKIERISCA